MWIVVNLLRALSSTINISTKTKDNKTREKLSVCAYGANDLLASIFLYIHESKIEFCVISIFSSVWREREREQRRFYFSRIKSVIIVEYVDARTEKGIRRKVSKLDFNRHLSSFNNETRKNR